MLGDVLIFTSETVHMSTNNVTNIARISCDTRWRRKSHAVDAWYVGENFDIRSASRFGLYSNDETTDQKYVSIESLKRQWGFY